MYNTIIESNPRERENKMEFVYEYDNMNRQLDLLRDANRRLQDTNDGLRSVVDIGSLSRGTSPRVSCRDFTSLISCNGAPPDVIMAPSDNEITDRYFARSGGGGKKRKKNGKNNKHGSEYFPGGGGSNSASGGSHYDSDSLRSRASCDSRTKMSDIPYGMRRFMDDLQHGER